MHPIEGIAAESEKTKKARLKLQKYLDRIDKSITQEALKLKVQEIHKWISRHAHTRKVLRNTKISLFDENQNAAKISGRVSNILSSLQSGFAALSHLNVIETDLKEKIDGSKSID